MGSKVSSFIIGASALVLLLGVSIPEISALEVKDQHPQGLEPGSEGKAARPDGVEKEDASPAKGNDEVGKLKERIIAAQNKGKLGFKKIVACSAVAGFGDYSPLEPGQPVPKLVLYCEPTNVSTLQSGDRYVIDCTVDVLITDSAGKILLGKEGLLKINRVARSPIIDLYFQVGMTTKNLMGRTIHIKMVLHDKVKNQSSASIQTVTLPGSATKSTQDKI